MRRLLFVPALGVAALALTAPAQAQTRGWLDDGRSYPAAQQSFYDSGRVAYDNGFREGLKQGEKDGRKNDRSAIRTRRRSSAPTRAITASTARSIAIASRSAPASRPGTPKGIERYAPNYGYGNGRYSNGRTVPRRDIGDRYGYPNPSNRPVYPSYPDTYGGYGGYNDLAVQNGVNDGYEKGLDDARKNRSFDPLRQEWYRSGDRHYDSRYGSREQYKDLYRQGFREGYERGFNEGRY